MDDFMFSITKRHSSSLAAMCERNNTPVIYFILLHRVLEGRWWQHWKSPLLANCAKMGVFTSLVWNVKLINLAVSMVLEAKSHVYNSKIVLCKERVLTNGRSQKCLLY